MEMLNGQQVNIFPFKEVRKISDLIFYEGPILSHFKDAFDKDLIFYWVDFDSEYNRWLVFQVSERQLYGYLLQKLSLYDLIVNPANDCYYTVEIPKELKYENVSLLYKGELPSAYIPEVESLFSFDIPQLYTAKVKEYEDSYFIETLREKALYLKVKPTELTSQSAVGVFEAKDFLAAFGTSFIKLMEYAVMRDFKERVNDNFDRLKYVVSKLKDLLEPKIVQTAYSSFAVAITPNTFSPNPDTFINRDWKEKIFQEFKEDVVDFDYSQVQNVDEIVGKYNDEVRYEIYKPLIDLYNNKQIVIEITDKKFNATKTIRPIKKEYVDRILKKKEKLQEEGLVRLAYIKTYPNTNKNKVDVLELFDQNVQEPVWKTMEIKAGERVYKLNRKLYADYRREENNYILENDELGIYVHGESLPDAEAAFYEEFDFIYNRYNDLPNEQLTEDVLRIKDTLNNIVEK